MVELGLYLRPIVEKGELCAEGWFCRTPQNQRRNGWSLLLIVILESSRVRAVAETIFVPFPFKRGALSLGHPQSEDLLLYFCPPNYNSFLPLYL